MTDHDREIEEFGQNDDFWLFGYGSLIWKPPPHYDQRVPGYIEGYVRRFWQASEDHRGTPEAPGRVATLIDRAHWDTLSDHHEPTERVWGAAYHIPTAKVAEVRSYLDLREINGYSIQFTPFHPAPFVTSITSPPTSPPEVDHHTIQHQLEQQQQQRQHELQNGAPPLRRSITASTTILAQPEKQQPPIKCLVYIGLPSNPQFLGPQDPQGLAAHILKSSGPSGENKEYLFALEKSLLELSKDSGDAHVSDLVRRAKEIEARERGADADLVLEEEDEEEKGARGVGVPLHRVGSTEEQEEVEK